MTFIDTCCKILEQLAKGKTIEDIASEKNKPVKDIKKELNTGKQVEREHTPSAKKAEKIAKDHLIENPKYYSKLKKAGL